MDPKLLHNAIRELRKQKQQINQVILMLESLAAEKPRRGRPPKLLTEALAAFDEPAASKPPIKKAKKARPK